MLLFAGQGVTGKWRGRFVGAAISVAVAVAVTVTVAAAAPYRWCPAGRVTRC